MSDHKNAFGIEFGLFWQFLNFLIFGVLRINSEPGSTAFWSKLEVLPSCRARENRIKHRLWWFQCAGDRKIEPSGPLWLSTSPNPTLAFFLVLAKSLNRKYRFLFSLETIFEHFPVSETFFSYKNRSSSQNCTGYVPAAFFLGATQSFPTSRKQKCYIGTKTYENQPYRPPSLRTVSIMLA